MEDFDMEGRVTDGTLLLTLVIPDTGEYRPLYIHHSDVRTWTVAPNGNTVIYDPKMYGKFEVSESPETVSKMKNLAKKRH